MDKATYGVFVSGVAGTVEQFRSRLVAQGMSEQRAAQVVGSLPCFVKRDVPIDVARRYKDVFQRAGAWVVIENWQTTQNPAACDAFVERPADEPELEFAVPVGTGTGTGPVPAAELDPEQSEPEPVSERVAFTPIALSRPGRIKQWTPAAIALGIFLLAGSYVYGCVHVLGQQSDLRAKVADLGVALENYNARGVVVTPDLIVEEVQELGRRVGVEVAAAEVDISPEEIKIRRDGVGGCAIVHLPDTVRHLPAWERDNILRNMRSCSAPRWIIGIRVTTRLRWGLYSQRVDFERYAPVLRYSEIDDEG